MKKLGILLLVLVFSLTSFAAVKEWTFMVFLNADNNLERFGIADFNEMEQIGSTDKINIVVEMDRAKGYDTSNGDWTGAKRFYVTHDTTSKIASEVVQDLGEVDMGSYKEAVDFFKWAVKKFPAKRYAFVFWNHGAGWIKKGNGEVVKGVSYDDQSGNHINSPDLKKAVDMMAATIGRKVDLVGFDACLMGMAEIQGQLAESVDVMVGSEETEPGDGWPYTPILKELAKYPTMKPENLGKVIVNEYMDSYEGQSSWWGPTACTQAASKLSKYYKVEESVDALAKAIYEAKDYDTLDYAMRYAQSYAYSFYKDLWHLADLIAEKTSNNTVKVRAEKVKEAVDSTIIIAKWQADKMKNSHGLSIYAPKANEYKSTYKYTEFAKHTAWDEMLQDYYGHKDNKALVEEFNKNIGTDKEEAIAKNIITEVELGNTELYNQVKEAAENNPKAYADLMSALDEVVAAK